MGQRCRRGMHESIELAVASRTRAHGLALAERARALFLVLPWCRIPSCRARLALRGAAGVPAATAAVTATCAVAARAAIAALGGEGGQGALGAQLQGYR